MLEASFDILTNHIPDANASFAGTCMGSALVQWPRGRAIWLDGKSHLEACQLTVQKLVPFNASVKKLRLVVERVTTHGGLHKVPRNAATFSAESLKSIRDSLNQCDACVKEFTPRFLKGRCSSSWPLCAFSC